MAESKKKTLTLLYIIFILYIAVLCWFCFFAETFGRIPKPYYRYNFTPFNQLRCYIDSTGKLRWSFSFVMNICGNIAVFIPFGLLYPQLFKARRVLLAETALIALLFSTCIECIQFFSKTGVCDVDDLILNTLGGIIGFIVYRILRAFRKKAGR